VDHISNRIWEIVKWIGDSLEVEDDESNNDLFYTPPSSPSKPINVELEEHLIVDHARRHSCIMFENHLKICD
jgi:uncharacterized RmlC-like cupin family protein